MNINLMDTLQSLLYAFTSQGLIGLVLLTLVICLMVMALMFYVYHRTRIMDLAHYVAEQKEDRQFLAQLVENNTVAMTRNSAIIQHCTLVTEYNHRLLQRFLDRYSVRR